MVHMDRRDLSPYKSCASTAGVSDMEYGYV